MSDPQTTGPIAAKKSYREGHVAVGVKLSSRGWQGPSIKIETTADLTVAEARALAVALVQLADVEDAKSAAKADKEQRRKQWRDREVAAGRMKIMSLKEFIQ